MMGVEGACVGVEGALLYELGSLTSTSKAVVKTKLKVECSQRNS